MRLRYFPILLLAALAGCGRQGHEGPGDPGKSLDLLAPRNGALLVHESPEDVRWMAKGLAESEVVLEASWDGGSSWDEVARAAAEARRLSWTPAATGREVLLRLASEDRGLVSRTRTVEVRPYPVEIVPGLGFMVASMSDGSVYFWGNFPETFYRDGVPLPAPLAEIAGARPVSAARQLLSITEDGRLLSWGDFDGNAERWDPVIALQPVPGLMDISFAATGPALAFAVDREGRAWGWGINFYFGSVGDGTNEDRLEPVRVPALDGSVAIAVGELFAYALLPDGTVLSWGQNGSGQLGDGTYFWRAFPDPIPGLDRVVKVAAGSNYGIALRDDGTVWTWGSGGWGQLGDGVGIGRPFPMRVEGLPEIVDVQSTGDTSYALDREGRLWAWGRNSRGQAGTGTTEYSLLVPTLAAAVPLLERFFAGGYAAVHGFTKDGKWIAWGFNMFGALGDGTYRDAVTPVVLLER